MLKRLSNKHISNLEKNHLNDGNNSNNGNNNNIDVNNGNNNIDVNNGTINTHKKYKQNSSMTTKQFTNEIFVITYDNYDLIKNAKGIISFTVYSKIGEPSILELDNTSNIDRRHPVIYSLGLLQYLNMCTKDEWKGWKIIIHTDKDTIDNNPNIFKTFEKNGAIIGVVTQNTSFKHDNLTPSRFKSILRISRFLPMFYKNDNISVLIRDADTLFPDYLTELYTIKNTFIIDEFINKLSSWESIYVERMNNKPTSVVFGYDYNWFISDPIDNTYDTYKNSNINININSKNCNMYIKTHQNYKIGKKSINDKEFKNDEIMYYKCQIDKSKLYSYIRLLAGIVGQSAPSLPWSIWENELPKFIKEKLDKYPFDAANFDEYFLTNIIYSYCKEANITKYFIANYLTPHSLYYLYLEYIKAKYPTFKTNIIDNRIKNIKKLLVLNTVAQSSVRNLNSKVNKYRSLIKPIVLNTVYPIYSIKHNEIKRKLDNIENKRINIKGKLKELIEITPMPSNFDNQHDSIMTEMKQITTYKKTQENELKKLDIENYLENGLNKENKNTVEIPKHSESYILKIKQKFLLDHPDIHMTDEAFKNPLKNDGIFPLYKYGGKRFLSKKHKKRTYNKHITYKHK
jgi:hypothetical protein